MGFMPVLVCLLTVLGLDQSVTAAEPAAPRKGLVATVNPVATEARLQALRDGGNAVDAAFACALTLGVVDGHN
jgi:gamma-glutamyltranspeptidase/glutathione hydrolase